MKAISYIFSAILITLCSTLVSQTLPFRENAKWGIKENEKVIITPIYDTIFNFDSTGKVCLACHRTRVASASKFIKMTTVSYACNYLNRKNERLHLKTESSDTCSVFSFGKTTLKQFRNNTPVFVAGVKGKKYLVDKDFRQLTFKGYHDINPCADPGFYVTQFMNEGDVILTGLVNSREEEVIPHQYSNIKINPNDSVIIACSAGVRSNADDDIFDYAGKKKEGSHRHIDMATRNFLIHQIFEPKDYFIIYNIKTKEEKNLNADEVQFFEHDEILIRIKHDWFVYDMNTHQRKPFKQS